MSQQRPIRQNILTKLCEELPDDDAIRKVYRSRVAAFQAKILPVCAVEPGLENVVRDSHDGFAREFHIVVAFIAGRDSPDESTPLDDLIESAVARIEQVVGDDPTFGGIARDAIVQTITWRMEPGEEDFIGALFDVVVYYDTTFDPTKADAIGE